MDFEFGGCEDFGDFGDERFLEPYEFQRELTEQYARSDDEEPEEEEGDWEYERDDPMDGDHESALASCGWGMDEDYGDYGGGDDY